MEGRMQVRAQQLILPDSSLRVSIWHCGVLSATRAWIFDHASLSWQDLATKHCINLGVDLTLWGAERYKGLDI
eukprot:1160234-Pelagomonas_calceolata.AAC.6